MVTIALPHVKSKNKFLILRFNQTVNVKLKFLKITPNFWPWGVKMTENLQPKKSDNCSSQIPTTTGNSQPRRELIRADISVLCFLILCAGQLGLIGLPFQLACLSLIIFRASKIRAKLEKLLELANGLLKHTDNFALYLFFKRVSQLRVYLSMGRTLQFRLVRCSLIASVYCFTGNESVF